MAKTARAPRLPRGTETKDVTGPCLDWLRLMGFFAWRQNTGSVKFKGTTGKDRFVKFGFRGISDILGVLPDGKFLAVETKRRDGVLSEDQTAFLGQVQAKGGVAIVAYCLDDLCEALRARGYVK